MICLSAVSQALKKKSDLGRGCGRMSQVKEKPRAEKEESPCWEVIRKESRDREK